MVSQNINNPFFKNHPSGTSRRGLFLQRGFLIIIIAEFRIILHVRSITFTKRKERLIKPAAFSLSKFRANYLVIPDH